MLVEKLGWNVFKVRWKQKGSHRLFRTALEHFPLLFYVTTMPLIGVCKDRAQKLLPGREVITPQQRPLNSHLDPTGPPAERVWCSWLFFFLLLSFRDKMFCL